jgi:hypothetical protein
VETASNYFVDMGFDRPPGITTADFLTSLTNPAERIVREGFESKVPLSSSDFAARWNQSMEAATLASSIREFNAAYPLDNSRSRSSFTTQGSRNINQGIR